MRDILKVFPRETSSPSLSSFHSLDITLHYEVIPNSLLLPEISCIGALNMTGPFSPDPTYVSLLFEDVKDATDRFVRNPHETARLQMVKSLGKMIASTSDPVQEVYSIAGMVSYTH